MKLQRITLLAITLGLAGAPGFAQTPGKPPEENQSQAPATAQEQKDQQKVDSKQESSSKKKNKKGLRKLIPF